MEGRCLPVGRGALHPQRSGGCKPPPPCRQLPHQSGILFWLLSFIPHPHHGSWNHTPCLRLGLKDARGSALLCFSPCDKAGRGVTKFTCTWRGKAFLPLGKRTPENASKIPQLYLIMATQRQRLGDSIWGHKTLEHQDTGLGWG